MTPDEQLRYVQRGHGKSGANVDYVMATVEAMRALGIRDRGLEWLSERLKPEKMPRPRGVE